MCIRDRSLVLPKEVRKKLKIKAGEKMALLNVMSNDEEFFLTLIKANALEDLVKSFMAPVMKDLVK